MSYVKRAYRGEVDVNRLRLYSLGEVRSEQYKGVFRGREGFEREFPAAGRYCRCDEMSQQVLQQSTRAPLLEAC